MTRTNLIDHFKVQRHGRRRSESSDHPRARVADAHLGLRHRHALLLQAGAHACGAADFEFATGEGGYSNHRCTVDLN